MLLYPAILLSMSNVPADSISFCFLRLTLTWTLMPSSCRISK